MARLSKALLAAAALAQTVFAQSTTSARPSTAAASSSCTLPTVSAKVPAPSVAPGYQVRLVASGLTSPRGITFDEAGHLLVIEQQSGLVALSLNDNGGSCVTEASRHTVINDTSLNHGIALSQNGSIVYVSSAENVTYFAYSPGSATVSGPVSVAVTNMTTNDHTTRTLLVSKFLNDTLLVSRGSTSNIDPEALELATGHSQIRAFRVARGATAQNFNTFGTRLGWGLRNDVGVAEHPVTGGIWSVENSADDVQRDNVDVHENNPAEELNYLGTLVNNTSPNQGANFGYPECFTAWNVSELPEHAAIQVGQQFALSQNSTTNDTACRNDYVAPRIAFQSHMAPLDIKFNADGSEAWVSFHGSWDRQPPSGYKVGVVQFTNGDPSEPSNSTGALIDIVSNGNITACPGSCFRPVGLAWDRQGRLFFSSDATGEIYVITRSESTSSGNGGGSGSTTSSGPTSTGSGSAASGTAKPSKAASTAVNLRQMLLLFAFFCLSLALFA